MASSLAISLAKIRAEAIREAAMAVSADDRMHNPKTHIGVGCYGCRWRAKLNEFALIVEHEADDAEGGDTDGR